MTQLIEAEVRRHVAGHIYGVVRWPSLSQALTAEEARNLSDNLRTLAIDIERGQIGVRTYPEQSA
ncbi:hypothetical protein [Pseudomonas typographi]|uniref:Uncharacterized protein n=1 Tax=Pseudomonas typographi TaxID=2715964 RepID=A0ABR7ZA45_9PSED|nr:hypothetical protein [Pseudomonas typographi]MBD1602434.1 hypothetical protein [Pseudomonas typographi]